MLFSFYAPLSDPGRNATVLRIWGASIHRAKKALAIIGVCDDIVAVRHDLPHMPSLGVSSLDSRPPWRHGGLLFCRYFRARSRSKAELICPDRAGAGLRRRDPLRAIAPDR